MARPSEKTWRQVSHDSWRFLRRCGVKGLKTLDKNNNPVYVAESWAVAIMGVVLFPHVKFNSKRGKAIRRAVKDREFRDAIEAASDADLLPQFLQNQA